MAIATPNLRLIQSPSKEPKKAESVLDFIGDTPLLQIHRIVEGISPGVRIFAKLEGFNPGGSVKDRIGLPMIEAAERAGLLKPGATLRILTNRKLKRISLPGAAGG